MTLLGSKLKGDRGSDRRTLRAELRPTLTLALPVIASELGWMAMGIVDTAMVGRLGAEAIGAVSIGSLVFLTVAVFGMGLLLGMDPMVAQAFGAGRIADCHRTLLHGVYLCLALTLPLIGLQIGSLSLLASWRIHPAVLGPTIPYLKSMAWGTLPLLLFFAIRRYLQAIGLARAIMVALISANAINAVANWVLIYGRMGFPAMGVEGSGWSTTIARFYLFLFLLGALVIEERRRPTGLFRVSRAPEWARFRKMLSLGIPASAQITLELSVFAVTTMFAGRFEPSALAAHQIVLNASSLTFMVPLGVASAGAVRVGHALGRDDPPGAGRAGWMAIILGSGFMACAGLAFLLGPGPILAVFTADRDVISVALSLLFVAAVFQLFDGLQVVATGVLRGTGETRTPMVTNLLAHWGLGLPMGYALAFWCGWGLFGLWVGLSVGLIAAGLVLVCLWAKKARDLAGPGSGLAGEAAVREVETA